MNQLWVRITTAASLLSTAGGGAAYYALSGPSDSELANAETPPAAVAPADESNAPPRPIPAPPSFGDMDSPTGMSSLGAPETGAGYDEPAATASVADDSSTAVWSGENSQPRVRQVSNEAPYGQYGGGYGDNYASPSSGDGGVAYGDAAYGGTAYGDSVDGAPSGAAAYGDIGDESPAMNDPAQGPLDDSYAGDVETSGAPLRGAPQDPTAAYGYGDSPADVYGAAGPGVGDVASGADLRSPAAISGGAGGAAELGPIDPTVQGVGGSYDDAAMAAQDAAASATAGAAAAPGALDGYGAGPPAADAGYASSGTLGDAYGFAGAPAAPPAAGMQGGQATLAAGAAAGLAAGAAGAELLSATPGPRTLDGRQQPSVTIEKRAPAEIQVGRPAKFELIVHNVGQATAHHVVVTDQIPQGTEFVDAVPPPARAEGNMVAWHIDQLEAGEDVVISLELMPTSEGEIGSVAHVSFHAQASVRTVCTKPQLAVEMTVQPKVLIGDNAVFQIAISNPGSGAATGVHLEEDVPDGLSHAAGRELEYEIGMLKPGETRRLELVLQAAAAGRVANMLRVRADGNLSVESTAEVEVIAPQLQVALNGPRRRYVERQVTYEVAFANPGTATANNITMSAYLPNGLKFISTGGKGRYDANTHSVHWQLEQLPPGEQGTVQLTALPTEPGEQKLRLEGAADLELTSRAELTTAVEGIVELVFTVSDLQDPIEVGSETTYEVRVGNLGTTMATNVRMAATLPAGLKLLEGDGPTAVNVQGQQAVMEPLPRLAPQEEVVYRIKAQGATEGDHVIAVQLISDEISTPVSKQEYTKVYADGR